jgi:hypothetical protein
VDGVDITTMTTLSLAEHELGLTWTIPGEAMERSGHALVADGAVWLVDPIDDASLLERAAALGPVAGVVQLLDRHNRDCASIAARLGVEHRSVPEAMPGTPWEAHRVLYGRGWKEVALWWPERRALVVAEAVGTAETFAVGPGPVGVHPMLRLLPPKALRPFAPEHLLVGHGPALHGPETAAALTEALDRSRRDAPRILLKLPQLAPAAAGRLSDVADGVRRRLRP